MADDYTVHDDDSIVRDLVDLVGSDPNMLHEADLFSLHYEATRDINPPTKKMNVDQVCCPPAFNKEPFDTIRIQMDRKRGQF
jgi:hypothetical protein